MSVTKAFRVEKPENIKEKVLNWLKQFNTFCFLDSNFYSHQGKTHEVLIGAGAVRKFEHSGPGTLEHLEQFLQQKKSWLFGHLAYELQTAEQRDTGKLISCGHADKLQFADACFFEPEIVLGLQGNELNITAENPGFVFEDIISTKITKGNTPGLAADVNSRVNREEYINIIQKLQKHIHRGDCYEINFCLEFFADDVEADPFALFDALNKISPNPFCALYRISDKWLICASPERFLQKKGRRIISQPIKGTSQRLSKGEENLIAEQEQLQNNVKEKAENVMVVDLVRNDLSRVCERGSVKVDELFGIYSFPQVHQMISTVSGNLNAGVNFTDIINATFPMGSMTGAPKINVMRLIDGYEKSKRGIFSGTVGYIDPFGDFDFNVVIRSIMYNQSSRYLSFQVGSGITIYADAEKEWEECMIKAAAIKKILSK